MSYWRTRWNNTFKNHNILENQNRTPHVNIYFMIAEERKASNFRRHSCNFTAAFLKHTCHGVLGGWRSKLSVRPSCVAFALQTQEAQPYVVIIHSPIFLTSCSSAATADLRLDFTAACLYYRITVWTASLTPIQDWILLRDKPCRDTRGGLPYSPTSKPKTLANIQRHIIHMGHSGTYHDPHITLATSPRPLTAQAPPTAKHGL
jgi:hypothetical protein